MFQSPVFYILLGCGFFFCVVLAGSVCLGRGSALFGLYGSSACCCGRCVPTVVFLGVVFWFFFWRCFFRAFCFEFCGSFVCFLVGSCWFLSFVFVFGVFV